MKTRFLILIALLLLITARAEAEPEPNLKKVLEPLDFLAGWCWSGEFPDGKRVDTHCYEPAFAGSFLRDKHVVTGGPTHYEGETIFYWNSSEETISYFYWNSAGGVSEGSVIFGEGSISFPDEFYVGADGAEVKITSSWQNITDDGYDSITTEVFVDGQNKERSIRYRKVPKEGN